LRTFFSRLSERVLRWARDPANSLWVAAGLAVVALALMLRYAALSDYRNLALNRLQDDAYYYLQPAWLFGEKRFFTFDGLHPTYGFQPLWMLVLVFQAMFTPDKIAFVRAAVSLGAVFYCLAGFGLYVFARRWLGTWEGVVPEVLWLFNPTLASIFLTAKENALYAFLLTAAAVLLVRRLRNPGRPRDSWLEGLVLGLMVLCRINAVVPAALMTLCLALFSPEEKEARLIRSSWLALGASAVLLPWCLYALHSFGTVFPNSGSAKLLDTPAAVVWAYSHVFPWPSLSRLAAWLPAVQRQFLSKPDFLTLPTRNLAVSYFIGYLPDLALDSWSRVVPFPLPLPYALKLLGIAAILLTVLAWVTGQWVRRTKAPSAGVPASDRSRGVVSAAIVLTVLLLSAAVNGFADWLLLPGYLFWGIWYAVPETVAIILGVAGAGVLLVGAVCRSADRWGEIPGRVVRAVFIGLGCWTMLVGLASSLRGWELQSYDPAANPTQSEAYLGIRWVNGNLPPGSRIGSYSAGLIGYFAENMHVVNLDGLANTPGFVTRDVLGHLLFLRGLAATDPIVGYLKEEAIGYLANVDPVDRVQNGPYLGLVPTSEAQLLYVGKGSIDWGPGQPLRKFIVAQLRR
jgi:hypothetical protein